MNQNQPRLSPAEIIRDAMALIEQRGWCQNALQDNQGRLCLQGALLTAAEAKSMEDHSRPWDRVLKGQTRFDEAWHAVNKVSLAENGTSPIHLNDSATATQEQVLAVMEKAAINLETAID